MAKRLSVPYHKQMANGYCLPACVQVVLAYQKRSYSQADLGQKLNLRTGLGAPTRAVKRLVSDELKVVYGEGSLLFLKDWLKSGMPIIAFVQSGELAYWGGEVFQHTVVIIGVDGDDIWLLDPDQTEQPIAVATDEFLLAWSAMDYLCAILVVK
jgi:ABC-type bacteriocin/lantibiotic exporter with double-glycine peptidase domain